MLLAYEFLYRREIASRAVLFPDPAPAGALRRRLGVYILFRVRALGGFAPFSGTYHRLTPWQNFLSVPVLIAQYVLKLFWPTHLNYYYHFIPQSAPGWKFFASVLLIAALVAAMFLSAQVPSRCYPSRSLGFSSPWFPC